MIVLNFFFTQAQYYQLHKEIAIKAESKLAVIVTPTDLAIDKPQVSQNDVYFYLASEMSGLTTFNINYAVILLLTV